MSASAPSKAEKGSNANSGNSDSAEMEVQHFIKSIIVDDLEKGKHQQIITRFPPEPNGYLHIGHCKSICLNFSLAEEFEGECNLRFDDTNPTKEEQEFVDAIQADIEWLGFNWAKLRFASDYFDQLYDWALLLIDKGLAYVCDLSPEEMREYRGTLTEPGRNSPYRERSPEENRELFEKMRAGEFEEGACTLRAKIDMASSTIVMRDPVMYRILKKHHHRTGDKWCIYPAYDYTHGLSDAIENITHSLCTVEFEKQRPLYEWFIQSVGLPDPHPRQIEFAPLVLAYEMTSKRNLRRLVEEGIVNGWDDPRMPTIRGMRRRGYMPEGIREFCKRIGLAKADNLVDRALFYFCQREVLNVAADRAMAVLDPLKLTITTLPEGHSEEMDFDINPNNPDAPKRKVRFSRNLLVERSDFMEEAPRKWFRLTPGKEVRLKHGYYVTCDEVIKNDAGEVIELRCSHDPETRGGWSDDGRKVKGTIHWVSAEDAVEAELREYDQLWVTENPRDILAGEDVMEHYNEDSFKTRTILIEPFLGGQEAETRFQFLRHGYYTVDADSTADKPVFNSTVGLRDSWAKKK